MNFQTATQITASDRVIAATLAAISMFVVGYSATRVYLSQSASTATPHTVIPHQATLWGDLGQSVH